MGKGPDRYSNIHGLKRNLMNKVTEVDVAPNKFQYDDVTDHQCRGKSFFLAIYSFLLFIKYITEELQLLTLIKVTLNLYNNFLKSLSNI